MTDMSVDVRPQAAGTPAQGRLCWCGEQATHWVDADPYCTPGTVECREVTGASVACVPCCFDHAA